MKKKVITSALIVLITACSADTSDKDPEYVASVQCTNDILSESKAQEAKGNSGRYKIEVIPRTKSVRDGTFVFTELRSIPYATSTYVDNGVEGSAWRKCMEQSLREKN